MQSNRISMQLLYVLIRTVGHHLYMVQQIFNNNLRAIKLLHNECRPVDQRMQQAILSAILCFQPNKYRNNKHPFDQSWNGEMESVSIIIILCYRILIIWRSNSIRSNRCHGHFSQFIYLFFFHLLAVHRTPCSHHHSVLVLFVSRFS